MTITIKDINEDFKNFLSSEHLRLLMNRDEIYYNHSFDETIDLANTFKIKSIYCKTKEHSISTSPTVTLNTSYEAAYFGDFLIVFELNGTEFEIQSGEDRIDEEASNGLKGLRCNLLRPLNMINYQEEYAEGVGFSKFLTTYFRKIRAEINVPKKVIEEFWHLLNLFNLSRHVQAVYDYSFLEFIKKEAQKVSENVILKFSNTALPYFYATDKERRIPLEFNTYDYLLDSDSISNAHFEPYTYLGKAYRTFLNTAAIHTPNTYLILGREVNEDGTVILLK